MAQANGSYDLVVIGAGPGGYVAAIRAAQLGMRVACVDKRETLGGTCLNVGCIPSKALLQSSEKFAEAAHGLSRHGITVGKPKIDIAAMLANKDKIVSDNTGGVAFLFKKHKIESVTGAAKIEKPGVVAVNSGAPRTLNAKNILVATGSESIPLRGVEVDEKRIVTSTGALTLDSVPKKLVVIGAGYIGLELGSVWSRLGAQVTVIEFLDRIVPAMDGEIAKQLHRTLEKQGLKFRLSTKVTGAEKKKNGVTLTLEPSKGGKAETMDCDVVLVAIGRRPYTEGLGLAEAGVAIDNAARIKIDGRFQTYYYEVRR